MYSGDCSTGTILAGMHCKHSRMYKHAQNALKHAQYKLKTCTVYTMHSMQSKHAQYTLKYALHAYLAIACSAPQSRWFLQILCGAQSHNKLSCCSLHTAGKKNPSVQHPKPTQNPPENPPTSIQTPITQCIPWYPHVQVIPQS